MLVLLSFLLCSIGSVLARNITSDVYPEFDYIERELNSCESFPDGEWYIPVSVPWDKLCEIPRKDLMPMSKTCSSQKNHLQKRIAPGLILGFRVISGIATVFGVGKSVHDFCKCKGTVCDEHVIRDAQFNRYLNHYRNPGLGWFALKWKRWSYETGWYKFTIERDDEKCLDGSSSGRNVYLHQCNGDNSHQFWGLFKAKDDSSYIIKHKQSDLCLDYHIATDRVQLQDCNVYYPGIYWKFL
jgi:hypothetical protein